MFLADFKPKMEKDEQFEREDVGLWVKSDQWDDILEWLQRSQIPVLIDYYFRKTLGRDMVKLCHTNYSKPQYIYT